MDYVQLLEGVKAHPYATVIAASVVNGRVTAMFVGAFVAQGYINPIIPYIIFVVMDVLGDMLYYSLGRIGNIGGKIIIRKNWQKRLSQFNDKKLKNNFPKALLLAKVSAIGSKPVIVAAGMGKMPLAKFLGVTVPCTFMS